MTKIIYDFNKLVIDIRLDKQDEYIKWTIQNTPNNSPTFTRIQIKTIIEVLQKSLDFEWEPQT